MEVEEVTTVVAIEIGADKIEDEGVVMETEEVTGPVLNVKIQTLPSEINVIAVKLRNLAGVTGIEENGAMEIVAVIGIALNVRTQTLPSEINVIAVKPRDLAEAGKATGIGRTEETDLLEDNYQQATEEALEAENAEDLEMEILDKVETQEVGVLVVQINLEEVVSVDQQVAEIAETDLVAVVEEDNFNF